MEKYMAPEMEIVEFDNEDVITTSGGCNIETIGCGTKSGGTPPTPGDDGFIWAD